MIPGQSFRGGNFRGNFRAVISKAKLPGVGDEPFRAGRLQIAMTAWLLWVKRAGISLPDRGWEGCDSRVVCVTTCCSRSSSSTNAMRMKNQLSKMTSEIARILRNTKFELFRAQFAVYINA